MLIPYGAYLLILPSQRASANDTACNLTNAQSACFSIVDHSWCSETCPGSLEDGILLLATSGFVLSLLLIAACMVARHASAQMRVHPAAQAPKPREVPHITMTVATVVSPDDVHVELARSSQSQAPVVVVMHPV